MQIGKNTRLILFLFMEKEKKIDREREREVVMMKRSEEDVVGIHVSKLVFNQRVGCVNEGSES